MAKSKKVDLKSQHAKDSKPLKKVSASNTFTRQKLILSVYLVYCKELSRDSG